MGSASNSPPLLARVGDYVLIRRIAVGGMAEVYEARRAGQGDDATPPVALKLLLPQHAADPDMVRAFEHEAKLQAALSHDRLVRLLDQGSAEGQRFLVMELVDGPPLSTLADWMRRRGRSMPEAVALYVVSEVLAALAYVHDATDEDGVPLGIVHRDVTPQNVLLGRDGTVRLGDLGIARSGVRDLRTTTGVIKGKLRYLAPEQATCSALDSRTDLYGAGLILWELLAGVPFIRGATEIEQLKAAEAPPFRSPSEVRPVDARLDVVLRRALARFPEERYPTAEAFRAELARIGGDGIGPPARAALGEEVREALAALADERATPLSTTSSATAGAIPRVVGRAEVDVEERPTARAGGRDATLQIPASPGRRARWAWPAMASVLGVAVLTAAAYAVSRREPARRTETAQDGARGTGLAVAPTDGGLSPSRRTEEAPDGDAAADGPDGAATVAAAQPDTGPSASSPPSSGRVRAATTPAPRRRADAGEPLAAEPSDPEAGDALAEASAAAGRGGAAAARLARVRRLLLERGVLIDDLQPGLRADIVGAARSIDADDVPAAEAALDRVEPAALAVSVDREFVQRKLSRVDVLIRRARERGEDTTHLEDLAAAALQELLDGRYEATNRRLNDILRLLDASARRRAGSTSAGQPRDGSVGSGQP